MCICVPKTNIAFTFLLPFGRNKDDRLDLPRDRVESRIYYTTAGFLPLKFQGKPGGSAGRYIPV